MYVYIHAITNEAKCFPDIIVEMDGGPEVYFDSPYVALWKHFNTDEEANLFAKKHNENR